jgi:hypothetical protein
MALTTADERIRCRAPHINRRTSPLERQCLLLRWAHNFTHHSRHRRSTVHSHHPLQNRILSTYNHFPRSTAASAPTSLTITTTSQPTAVLNSKSCTLNRSTRHRHRCSHPPAEEIQAADLSTPQHHTYTATAAPSLSSSPTAAHVPTASEASAMNVKTPSSPTASQVGPTSRRVPNVIPLSLRSNHSSSRSGEPTPNLHLYHLHETSSFTTTTIITTTTTLCSRRARITHPMSENAFSHRDLLQRRRRQYDFEPRPCCNRRA